MYHTAVSRKAIPWRFFAAFLLFSIFFFGFVAGTAVTAPNKYYYISLMCRAATSPVTIAGLLAQVVAPFSLTALIYRSKRVELFLVLSFVQAFIFGIASSSVYWAYGSAHWLIRTLLLFTGTITLISLLWFWFRHISGRFEQGRRDFFLCLSVSFLAAVLDYFLIYPLLTKLFI